MPERMKRGVGEDIVVSQTCFLIRTISAGGIRVASTNQGKGLQSTIRAELHKLSVPYIACPYMGAPSCPNLIVIGVLSLKGGLLSADGKHTPIPAERSRVLATELKVAVTEVIRHRERTEGAIRYAPPGTLKGPS